MATAYPQEKFEQPSAFQGAALSASLLNIGSLLLLGGTLTYSVVTLRNYEQQVGRLEAQASAPAKVSQGPPPATPSATDPRIKQLQDDLARTQAEAADAQQRADAQIKALEEQLAQARSSSGSSGDQIKGLQAQLDQDRTVIENLREQLSRAEAARREAEARAASLQLALTQAQEAQSGAQGRTDSMQQRIDELNQQISVLNDRFQSQGSRLSECSRAFSRARDEALQLRQRLEAQTAPVCAPQPGR